MPTTDTTSQMGPADSPPSGPVSPTTATAGRSRPVLTPAGRQALAEARAAADLVADHRGLAKTNAAARARAVRRASEGGASYRVIAAALDVSVGMVQQFMAAEGRLAGHP